MSFSFLSFYFLLFFLYYSIILFNLFITCRFLHIRYIYLNFRVHFLCRIIKFSNFSAIYLFYSFLDVSSFVFFFAVFRLPRCVFFLVFARDRFHYNCLLFLVIISFNLPVSIVVSLLFNTCFFSSFFYSSFSFSSFFAFVYLIFSCIPFMLSANLLFIFFCLIRLLISYPTDWFLSVFLSFFSCLCFYSFFFLSYFVSLFLSFLFMFLFFLIFFLTILVYVSMHSFSPSVSHSYISLISEGDKPRLNDSYISKQKPSNCSFHKIMEKKDAK